MRVEAPTGIRNLRDWLRAVEEIGELKRISQLVDWNEEMAAITYMVAKGQAERAPALLFDNIKDHPGYTALYNTMGPSPNRIALSVGMPPGLGVMEYVQMLKEKMNHTVPPVTIAQDDAPINEVIQRGDQVDLTVLPAQKMWPLDGGRYLGTSNVVITRDPEKGWLNLGSYRMMLHGKNELGFYTSPGRDARIHYEGWWKRGEPCQIAVALGCDPLLLAVAGTTFPRNRSEYEFAGGFRDQPVEVVPGIATDLLVPAHAEIVIEGVLRPENAKPEGPFGEFTGYYGRPGALTPVMEVTALRMRKRPILTCALMADYPGCEHGVLAALIRSARIWNDLDRIGIPGIEGVWSFPQSAIYGVMAVSLEQKYAGHAPQVLALASQVPAAAYYTKWIVAVDEDVDPSDINQVMWALSTRCNPVDDIDLLRNTQSTWLDPTQNPPDKRPYGSKALINACKEHKYKDKFAPRTLLRQRVYESVVQRWQELGLPGQPPTFPAFEDNDAYFDEQVYGDLM